MTWRGTGDDRLWWGSWSGIIRFFLMRAFVRGYLFGAEAVGEVIFRWQKVGLVRKLAGETSKWG